MSEEAHNREEKLVNEYEKKINSLKERFLEKENTNLKTFESEKGSADYRFKDRENSLLAKITALENSVSNLSEIKMELESKDKENRSRIRVLESEYNTTSNECDKLRKNNKDLELLKFNQEKQLTELNVNYFWAKNSIGTAGRALE
jgi:chromosome segregation ATPase